MASSFMSWGTPFMVDLRDRGRLLLALAALAIGAGACESETTPIIVSGVGAAAPDGAVADAAPVDGAADVVIADALVPTDERAPADSASDTGGPPVIWPAD